MRGLGGRGGVLYTYDDVRPTGTALFSVFITPLSPIQWKPITPNSYYCQYNYYYYVCYVAIHLPRITRAYLC